MKKRWAAVAVWTACIWGLGSLPGEQAPAAPLVSDKVAHFLAYAVLAVLILWALDAKGSRLRGAILAAVAAASGLGALQEFYQWALIPGRTGDAIDAVANLLGAAAAGAAWWACSKRRRRSH